MIEIRHASEERAEAAAVAEAAAEGARSAERRLQCELAELRTSVETAGAREAELRIALQQERELHGATLRLLHEQRLRSTAQASELQEKIQHVWGALERKGEDPMAIQFAMVDLQNRLTEQARACEDSVKEFKEGRAQLAKQDERVERQQELTIQMDE